MCIVHRNRKYFNFCLWMKLLLHVSKEKWIFAELLLESKRIVTQAVIACNKSSIIKKHAIPTQSWQCRSHYFIGPTIIIMMILHECQIIIHIVVSILLSLTEQDKYYHNINITLNSQYFVIFINTYLFLWHHSDHQMLNLYHQPKHVWKWLVQYCL